MVDKALGTTPLKVVHVSNVINEVPVAIKEAITTTEDRTMLANPATEKAWIDFLYQKQAAPVNQMTISVVLEGGRSKVRVVDMRPRIHHKGDRWSGAYFTPATAGEVGTVPLTSDLDQQHPAFFMAGNKSERYFTQRQIDLTRGEQSTVSMTFTARSASYEFDVVVTVAADDKTEEIAIHPDKGGLFRLTGRQEKPINYKQAFEEVDGAWIQAPAGQWCTKRYELQDCSP
ncbi:hypothetical protein ACFPFX_32720 [Streptomyces mauvecolor]|uniref:Uncharacterized protein n=1 Tax=Streptomyces mauvecolor TaxID=58345 RepID=A0ABV9UV46_9ACTN